MDLRFLIPAPSILSDLRKSAFICEICGHTSLLLKPPAPPQTECSPAHFPPAQPPLAESSARSCTKPHTRSSRPIPPEHTHWPARADHCPARPPHPPPALSAHRPDRS